MLSEQDNSGETFTCCMHDFLNAVQLEKISSYSTTKLIDLICSKCSSFPPETAGPLWETSGSPDMPGTNPFWLGEKRETNMVAKKRPRST